MANEEKEETLTIYDWENNTQYTLLLNHDDCLRAEKDAAFANSLLFHARAMTQSEKTALTNAKDSSETLINSASEESENGNQLGTWGYNETITLIHSMGLHMEDLNHPKKRKEVFEHVSNDLVSSGYSFNIEALKNKWKSLNCSYTKAEDSKKLSGRGPSRFMFYNEMDEIVGNKPTNKCNHSLNSLDKNMQEESSSGFKKDYISTENSSEGTDKTLPNKEKRLCKRTAERSLRKEYIEMKKIEYKRKQLRFENKLKLEEEKLETEKKKLMLLEELIKQKRETASK